MRCSFLRLFEAWATAETPQNHLTRAPFLETFQASDSESNSAIKAALEGFFMTETFSRAASFHAVFAEVWSTVDSIAKSMKITKVEAWQLMTTLLRNANAVLSDISITTGALTFQEFLALSSPAGFGPFSEFAAGDYQYQKALIQIILQAQVTADKPELPSQDATTKAVSLLDADVVNANLNAAADYSKRLPASNGKLFVAGFCWGGGKSFEFATHRLDLTAAIVFYGPPPIDADLKGINAPVYGFYGGNDARISASVPATVEAMKTAGKKYEPVVYEGAGHGFMRAGEDPAANAANKMARSEGFERLVSLIQTANASPNARVRPPMPAIGVPIAGMPSVHDPSTVVHFRGRNCLFDGARHSVLFLARWNDLGLRGQCLRQDCRRGSCRGAEERWDERLGAGHHSQWQPVLSLLRGIELGIVSVCDWSDDQPGA